MEKQSENKTSETSTNSSTIRFFKLKIARKITNAQTFFDSTIKSRFNQFHIIFSTLNFSYSLLSNRSGLSGKKAISGINGKKHAKGKFRSGESTRIILWNRIDYREIEKGEIF